MEVSSISSTTPATSGPSRRLYDLLAPGGVLVFSENFLHAGELRAPHQRSRTLAQVERVVRAAGFAVLAGARSSG